MFCLRGGFLIKICFLIESYKKAAMMLSVMEIRLLIIVIFLLSVFQYDSADKRDYNRFWRMAVVA